MKILKLTLFRAEEYYGLKSSYQMYTPKPQGQIIYPSSGSNTNSSGSGWLGGLGSLIGLGQKQLSYQQQLPQQITYTPPSINIKKEDFQELVYISLDSIVYFKRNFNNNGDHGTFLFLDHAILNIIETPEQINKMIHDLEFNNKIDKILSD